MREPKRLAFAAFCLLLTCSGSLARAAVSLSALAVSPATVAPGQVITVTFNYTVAAEPFRFAAVISNTNDK
jgi:hypothetical protein